MPIILFSLYVSGGNTLNLSAMAMTNMMMRVIQERLHGLQKLFHESFIAEYKVLDVTFK